MLEDSFCLLSLLLHKGRAGSTRISQQSADTLVGLFVGEQNLLNEFHLWLALRRVLDDQLHRVCVVSPKSIICLNTAFAVWVQRVSSEAVSFVSNMTLPAMVSSRSSGSPAHSLDQYLPLLLATAISDSEAMGLEDAFGRPRRAATWKH